MMTGGQCGINHITPSAGRSYLAVIFEHPFILIYIRTSKIPHTKLYSNTLRACAKRSRTLAGPTPTNISRNSDPEILRNGTPASPAVAFASSVFPVPGGPDKMAPCVIERGGGRGRQEEREREKQREDS